MTTPEPTPSQTPETVPIQAAESRRIDRAIAEQAYKEYAAQGHGDQSFERLHERGGFGAIELATFLHGRIRRLETQLTEARAVAGYLAEVVEHHCTVANSEERDVLNAALDRFNAINQT